MRSEFGYSKVGIKIRTNSDIFQAAEYFISIIPDNQYPDNWWRFLLFETSSDGIG